MLDGSMDWCTGLNDTGLAVMVQNGILVVFSRRTYRLVHWLS